MKTNERIIPYYPSEKQAIMSISIQKISNYTCLRKRGAIKIKARANLIHIIIKPQTNSLAKKQSDIIH